MELDIEIKRKLYAYCAYQERCTFEVKQKLKEWEVPGTEMDTWISHLESENFLDEDRFARSFVRGKFRYKKWGRRKIIRELQKKQVRERLIQSALRTEILEEDYERTLLELIQKKKPSFPLSPGQKQKLLFYLSQKGFEWGEIRNALETLEKRNKQGT